MAPRNDLEPDGGLRSAFVCVFVSVIRGQAPYLSVSLDICMLSVGPRRLQHLTAELDSSS